MPNKSKQMRVLFTVPGSVPIHNTFDSDHQISSPANTTMNFARKESRKRRQGNTKRKNATIVLYSVSKNN